MSKLDKLISKLCAGSTDVSFREIKQLLEAYGYEEVRVRGSHHNFRNPEGKQRKSIVVPKTKGQKVKRNYVDKVLGYLGIDSS